MKVVLLRMIIPHALVAIAVVGASPRFPTRGARERRAAVVVEARADPFYRRKGDGEGGSTTVAAIAAPPWVATRRLETCARAVFVPQQQRQQKGAITMTTMIAGPTTIPSTSARRASPPFSRT